jgi:hypothetical protein
VTDREPLVAALPCLPIPPRHAAFADKVVSGRVTETDITDLGLSDDDVFDLILSAALNAAHVRRRLGLALIKTIS